MSKQQVRQLQREFEGRGHRTQEPSGSGARPQRKADLEVDDRVKLEFKATDDLEYRVKFQDLAKIRTQAMHEGMKPGFVVTFHRAELVQARTWILRPAVEQDLAPGCEILEITAMSFLLRLKDLEQRVIRKAPPLVVMWVHAWAKGTRTWTMQPIGEVVL